MYVPSKREYSILSAGILGGPSCVFGRHFDADAGTPLSNKHTNSVKAVTSRDANSLYLSVTGDSLPVGPCYYRAAPQFKPECEYPRQQFSKISQQWLLWEQHKLDQPIQMGNNELKILNKYIDGLSGNRVYQFSGCWFHGCKIHTDHDAIHPMKKVKFGEIYAETMEFLAQLRYLGYEIYHIFECSFRDEIKENSELRHFIDTLPKPYKPCANITCEKDVLDAVRDKKLRGFLKADITVPEHLRSFYSNFEPIFKRQKISKCNLSGVMLEYCEKYGYLKTPQETLITSFFATQYVASTDLYAYYMKRGFEISNVTTVLEYEFSKPFKTFADKVVSVRREAERVDTQKPIANSMKLVGNTPYGKSISNIENYSSVRFVNKRKAQQEISKWGFKHITEISDDIYELDTIKSSHRFVLPTQFGAYVYSNAKLRLLQYVDFLRDHCNPDMFTLVYCDTDSVFCATSELKVEQCILPNMRDSYFSQYEMFNVPTFCPLHKQHFIESMTQNKLFVQPECCYKNEQFHNKTLGLFKVEQVFKQLTLLNSKSYYGIGFYQVHSGDDIWKNGDSKFSSKGMNHSSMLTYENYTKVLLEQGRASGDNKGFRSTLQGGMFTYKQQKFGLNFLYAKRHICDDYVSTEPLNL
jgi:hypothetical protein